MAGRMQWRALGIKRCYNFENKNVVVYGREIWQVFVKAVEI